MKCERVANGAAWLAGLVAVWGAAVLVGVVIWWELS
jgi:hypothetical protein